MDYKEALDITVRGTEKNKYHEIVADALEKQIPKKPYTRTIDEIVSGSSAFGCPICCTGLRERWVELYCPSCGQKLDWDL